MVDGPEPFGRCLVPDLDRQPGQIVDRVEVRSRIGGVVVVKLEPAEGGRGAADIVQLHQADAGHLPQTGAGSIGKGGIFGHQGVSVIQELQSIADPVLVHQGQGVDACGMRLDEPVRLSARDYGHLFGRGCLPFVVTDGQVVEMGDLEVSRVALGAGGGVQTLVPKGSLVELPLVQDGPGDVIEPVQALAILAGHRGTPEGLQSGEIGRCRAHLDRPCQGHGVALLRREGGAGQQNRQQGNEGGDAQGHSDLELIRHRRRQGFPKL